METSLFELLARGDPLHWSIAAASVLMWTLIVERYWFVLAVYPRRRAQAVLRWRARVEHSSWRARRLREGLIAELSAALGDWLLLIRPRLLYERANL